MTIEPKLTFALIVTVILQTAGVLFWTGAAAQRLETVEQKAEASAGISERLARLEAELAAVRTQLDRIERQMEADVAR